MLPGTCGHVPALKEADVKWFDGHLDLAFLAEAGRDFAREAG